MLYLIITGKLPFSAKNSSNAETPMAKNTPIQKGTPNYNTDDEVSPLSVLIDRHLKEEPDFLIDSIEKFTPESVRERLILLTKSLLEKDPNKRPQTASEVAVKLRNIANPMRMSVPPLLISRSA